MPYDFPPWQTVYDYYRRWVRIGLWEKLNQTLARKVRGAEGRESQPSLILSHAGPRKLAESAFFLTCYISLKTLSKLIDN